MTFIMAGVIMASGCGSSNDEYMYKLFYLSQDEDELLYKGYNAQSSETEDLVSEFLEELQTQPDEKKYKVPGLDATSILGWDISTEGILTINFSSEYSSFPIIKETLCRAAIVKSLCQIEGINSVVFNVEGDPVTDSNGQPLGFMSEETFVDNTSGETTYKQTINATVYFADEKGKHLIKIPINVTFDGTISMEQLIVEQLIKGPGDIKGLKNEVKAVIPENTKIDQVTVKEQVCYIDMSKEFHTAVDGVKRELTLYAIVNSLAELPDINKVQFTIDGDAVRYFGDSLIPFDVPLERKLELVKE